MKESGRPMRVSRTFAEEVRKSQIKIYGHPKNKDGWMPSKKNITQLWAEEKKRGYFLEFIKYNEIEELRKKGWFK